jgi:hypothetical protein
MTTRTVINRETLNTSEMLRALSRSRVSDARAPFMMSGSQSARAPTTAAQNSWNLRSR